MTLADTIKQLAKELRGDAAAVARVLDLTREQVMAVLGGKKAVVHRKTGPASGALGAARTVSG